LEDTLPDLLVPLYKLPPLEPALNNMQEKGIIVRRANTFELTPISAFIAKNFSVQWADENAAALSRQPITSFIAIESGSVIGFGTYESTRRAYFGPTGVSKSHRGQGVGTALLLACLHGLQDLGYAYAIIGSAGPVNFYCKTVNAIVIPDSEPGIYTNLLKKPLNPAV
jgi:GNAT superfamily N-acetyltransferase